MGMLLLRYAESYTRKIQPWVARTARLLVLGIIAVILLTKGDVVLANGLKPIIVSLIVILASFLLGWGMLFLTRRERASFGLTSMVRNLALALLLGTAFFKGLSMIAAMLTYALLMFIVAFAIAALFRRSTPALERAAA